MTCSSAEDDAAEVAADNVVTLRQQPRLQPLPEPIVAPSEKGLQIVLSAMLQQLGPHQTYNRLVDAARDVRGRHIARKGPPSPR
jgi:hypothetical protein